MNFSTLEQHVRENGFHVGDRIAIAVIKEIETGTFTGRSYGTVLEVESCVDSDNPNGDDVFIYTFSTFYFK